MSDSTRRLSPQPIWFSESAITISSKVLSYRLIGLAEVLLAEGRVDEAYGVARAALRGFVTLAEIQVAELDGLNLFLSAVEYFTSNKCKESPEMRSAVIRLYGRILNKKHAEIHDWDFAERAILRSCLLHGMSGGSAGAWADLQRKSKAWKMNPDSAYIAAAEMERSRGSSKIESDTEDEGVMSSTEFSRTPRTPKARGKSEKHIRQRQSQTIAEWLKYFN